ncbi:MAG: AbrB/MazE/SpoVT family DNA-binding domain-containing protein [Planctomycetes bacterium]|nr:AbrB/MazE/SpoVT family DNA-binding domain-containing protein [Planctomycetota bacterium]
MVKTLVRHGNSLALVIDRAILGLLRIDGETPLEVTTDGRCLVISPARSAAEKARFEKALGKVNRRYARALKKLSE